MAGPLLRDMSQTSSRFLSREVRANTEALTLRSRRRRHLSPRSHGMSADGDNAADRADVVEVSRRLVKYSQELRMCVHALVLGVVGRGITPVATHADAASPLSDFRSWCIEGTGADAVGLATLLQMERFTVFELAVAGDLLWIKHEKTGRLHFVEAERIGGDKMRGRSHAVGCAEGVPLDHAVTEGVETDANGRVVAFHYVVGYHEGGAMKQTTERVLAEHCFFLALRDSPNQLRGRPLLACAHDDMDNADSYLTSVVVMAKIQAMLGVSYETETPQQGAKAIAGAQQAGRSGASASSGPSGSVASRGDLEGEDDALVIVHRPGAKISALSSTQPAATLEMFLTVVVKRFCGVMGIPIERVKRDFSGANFSVARLAEALSKETFDVFREPIVSGFLAPLYEWWLHTERAAERRPLPDALIETRGLGADPELAVAWKPPPPIIVDPIKQANADRIRLEDGTVTYAEVCEQYDTTPEAVRADRLAVATLWGLDPEGIAPQKWLTGEPGSGFAPDPGEAPAPAKDGDTDNDAAAREEAA